MTKTDTFRMPHGLPTLLGSGKTGFNELCELLDVNTTRQKQSILKSAFVKQTLKDQGYRVARQTRTAERIQKGLIAFYGDPVARRELWREFVSREDDALDPTSNLIPSIEYEALKSYDESLVSAELDLEDIEDLEATADFYDPDLVDEDWYAAAIIALPRIRDDLDQWDDLSPELQEQAIVVAFAVSTLLDDVRFLRWATERIDGVAAEFPFLVSREVDTPTDKKPKDTVREPTEPVDVDALEELSKAAQGLSAAALRLVEYPASNELFDAVAEHAAMVEAFREPAIQEAASRNVEGLIDKFSALLDEKSNQAPWIVDHAEEIVAAWRATYASDGSPGADELNADLERAGRELSIHLDDWHGANTKETEARMALQDLHAAMKEDRTRSLKDRDLEFKYYEEIPKFGRAAIDATKKALTAALPAARATKIPQEPQPPQPEPEDDEPSAPAEPLPSPSSPEGEHARVTKPPSPDTTKGALKPSEPPPEKPVDQPPDAPRDTPPGKPVEPQAEPALSVSPVDDALWAAIRNGKLGLAYHIASLNEEVEDTARHPSSELLATVALGSLVSGPEEEIVQEFGRRVGAVFGNLDFGKVDQQTKDALNLLVFSASLRPALFAPQQTGAISMLKRVELSSTFTPVYRFAESMAHHADKLKGVQLDVSTVAAVVDEEVWQNRWEQHLERVDNWRAAPVPNFMFAPANHVWRHWTGSGGVLATLTDLVSRDNASSMQRVREILHALASKSVHSLFEDTWRNDLGQRIGGGASGRAVSQLERHLQEPIGLARKWLRILNARPRGTDWAKGEVEKLRHDIRKYGQTAMAALQDSQQVSMGLPLEAGVSRASEAIESLDRLLLRDQGVDTSASTPAVDALSGDLVHVPTLPLNEQGELDASVSASDALALIVDDEGHVDSLVAAFKTRFANGDFHGARAVCLRMSHVGDPNEMDCEQRLQEAIAARARHLQLELYELAEKLDQSFIMGEVAEDEYADLNASISAARRMLDPNDNEQTLAAIRDVRDINESVGRLFKACIEKTERRLREYTDSLSTRENVLIQDALDAGDLIALHEYVDCLKANRPLVWTETDECKSLKEFLSSVDGVSEAGDGNHLPTQDAIVQAVARREDILNLEFSALSASHAKQSTKLIEAWYLLARQGTANLDRLREFLGLLGFTPRSAKADPAASGTVVAVTTVPLSNRELCPVYSFGSAAEGHYDLILNWKPSARGAIVQAVGSNPNRHSIVLHFGRISREDRLWLRRWSIKNSNQFIVIDETLVLYLALSSDALRSLFDSTLPFACVEPFFTAAGLVPPECFYGRENERRILMDRYGSCFVYGGRQLGKTALLRSAEAAFHRPEKRHIAHCIDLQKFAIGTAVGADHLWNVLWDEFSKLGIITTERRGRRGRDRLVRDFTQALAEWLSNDKHSQILLLLDEADEFLKDDLNNEYRESRDLKGLMDETQRRFKVVLCGLHNVLRNTERANHPLAHFGKPICVGPLLGNGDREQARALIREPVAAAGYTFEKDSLLTHILVWTNYYPSLIQLFGEALLRHLRETRTDEFPRAVTRADIEAVFARDGFRDYIRQRFALTLQLDQRYEVIAYALAFELHGDPNATSRGVSAIEAMKLARNAWPDGFDISGREFDSLLREMCGLGILRRRQRNAGTARYTFRNPNVLLFFGNAETILDVLEKPREKPEVFEAAAYHAQYPQEDSAPERRGPLTFEQEGLLKGGGRVAVLCGTRIANVEACEEFLEQRLDAGLLRQLEPCLDAEGLRRKLNGFRPGRSAYVCMVDDSDPWAMRWIETTADMLTEGKVGAALRVVFCADAHRLWDLVSELPDESLGEQSNSRFDWVGLQPWNRAFLHRWCVDQNLHEAAMHLDELLELTGGWPQLVEHYARSGQKSWKARHDELQDHIVANRDKLIEALGLGPEEARQQMAALREIGELTLDDVDEYATLLAEEGNPAFASGALRRRLFWAIQLGLAQDVGGSWRLNPLVDRLLTEPA